MSGSLWEEELQQKTHDIYNEIKRLRSEGIPYDDVSNHLNELGYRTSKGKEYYGSYVKSIETRMEKRQRLIDRYKRTIEDLRVEFHYDDEMENERVQIKEKQKERKLIDD